MKSVLRCASWGFHLGRLSHGDDGSRRDPPVRDAEGSIRESGLADLIAVRDTGQDPADRLQTLSMSDIEFVMIGGRVQLAVGSVLERLPFCSEARPGAFVDRRIDTLAPRAGEDAVAESRRSAGKRRGAAGKQEHSPSPQSVEAEHAN